MKNMVISFDIVLTCCAAALLTSCATGPVPEASYSLVKDGKATSCLILPENAGVIEKHSAAELCAYIEKITGAKIETTTAPSQEKYNIYIGTLGSKSIPLTSKMKTCAKTLAEDGYLLAADGKGLRIVGRHPRGVLYGVYGLLKQSGQVRWFLPGTEGEYCPKSPDFSIGSGVTVVNPSFQSRTLNLCCANVNSKSIDTWDWMVRNGMQIETSKNGRKGWHPEERAKRGDENVDGGHSFSYLISDNLFDEHPEYFCLKDGKRIPQSGRLDVAPGKRNFGGQAYQPCTSNPKVVEIMTAKLMEWGETPPRGGSFLIGNNDSQGWCQCENCVRLDPPVESKKRFVSTRYWTLLNAMAEKAFAQNPELKLKGWAYQNFQEPPTGIVPDKRFSVVTCLHQRCYRHRMDDTNCPSNKRFRNILINWGKLNPISTYEYTDCLPGGDVVYLPLEHVFVHDLKYYHQIGVRGSLTETTPPDGVFGRAYDNDRRAKEMWPATWQFVYLMAYFLWDVNADYATVYEDMGSKFYGAAWPAMKQYREKLTAAWEATPGDMIYGTPDIALGQCLTIPGLEVELLILLDQAEKAAGNDEALLKKIRREREYFAISWQKMHKAWNKLKSVEETIIQKREGEITVDGILQELDWKKATATTGFICEGTDNPAKNQTFVEFLYDNEFLYVGLTAMEPAPGKLSSRHTMRDTAVWQDDDLEISLDPTGSGESYYHFCVNPKAAIYDARCVSESFDSAWNADCQAATQVLPDRWVLEMKIRADSLNARIADGGAWKINVARCRRPEKGEISSMAADGARHQPTSFRSAVFGKPLLKNGGFEKVAIKEALPVKGWLSGNTPIIFPNDWSLHGGNKGTLTMTGDDVHSGKLACALQNGWITSYFEANTGDTLQTEFWAKGDGSMSLLLFHYGRNAEGNMSFTTTEAISKKVGLSSEWQRYCFDYPILKENTAQVGLTFSATGAVLLDDINCKVVAKE